MSKKSKAFKVEGQSLNPAFVAGMTKEQFAKHAKDSGFFPTYKGKTPTPEQYDELVSRAYEQAHKEAGTEPAPAKAAKADPVKEK